jgi:GTP cyclohydrolase I
MTLVALQEPAQAGRGIDLRAAERAAADLLAALGADLAEEGLRETPRRMAAAYAERLTPQPFRPTTFLNGEGYDELVVARSIPSTRSACAICCRSTAWRTSATCRVTASSGCRSSRAWWSCSPAIRERLTVQIAGWLQERLAPKGVGVVLETERMCMSLRGVQEFGARTVTSPLDGLVRDDPRTRPESRALRKRIDQAH